MGNTHSGLDCSGKSKNKKKKKNRKNRNSNGTAKQLSDNLGNKNDAVDGLRTKSGDVTPRISQADKELVEERIKAIEKKHNELQSRALLSFKKNDMLGSDLHDVRQEVDTYMAWLADQEKAIKRTTPLGYSVKDAETKLTEQNDMCGELEERQATLNAVLHKAEGLLKDLPRKEREVVEKWVNMISMEHQRVYTMAVDKQKLIAESVQHRELFHTGLERVNLWLQAKEKELDDLQTIRLQSSDVEKQLDKCKTLESEVLGYNPNVQSLQRQVANLEKECTPEKAAELQHKMTDVQSRYEDLKTNMSDTHNRLKDSVGQRKLFESDVQKVDRWCKETEMKCAVEPCVDCAIEVLDDQYKHYKTLDNTSRMFESLVKEISDRGKTFYGQLYEADKFKLDNTLKTTSDKYEKVDSLVKSRLQTLECAINMRSQVSDEIAKANELLSQVQDDLRKANKPIGPTSEDAERSLQQYEAIAEKVAQYQPSITQLNQAIERLRNTGQNSEAEEILQITAQYELLEDQIEQQCRKCQHSMTLREQYAEQTAQVQALMEECKKEMAEIGQQGQSLPVRMEKLKAVSDKLASAEPLLAVVGDKAQQIGIESNSEDARKVMDDIHTLRGELEQLKKTSDKKAKQCEAIQRNREDYEATINEATMWLEQKEDVLASCSMLDMTPEKVDQAMDKHKTLAKEALDKLDLVKDKAQLEKAHYEKLEEPMPLAVVEKLEQIQTLEDSIKTAIAKKEAYLDEAKADRLQLNMSMKQITEWISGAEDMLDSGYEGLDYDTLNDTLSEHKDYFSEASMCQDEMEQVMELSERLLPTLDSNDKETLRQTLINTNQKLANVMASSQRKQQLMEQKTDDYQDYQELMYHVTEAIQEMEEEWTQLQHLPTTTPEDVQKQQEATKEFLAKVDEMRPTMNDLNDKARELEKLGNAVSRGTINKDLTNVNDRWNNLVCDTENKQMSLQDLGAQWEDYNTLVYGVETLLQEAEEALPNVDIENSTGHELVAQLNDTKGICSQLEVAEPKITALKRAAQNLQRSLPTAEAKVQSQEQVMALLEKLERIQDAAHEKEAALEEEIDDRAGFQTEADQTVAWLAETKTALVNMDPGKEVSDVMEKMEKQKVLEQEIAIRMEQMRHMGQLQETKYSAMGKEVPVEMKMQMASMRELEADVSVAMKAKEEELQHIKEDREEVTAALRDASAWLGEAELRLQERIIDIPDSQQRHQDLQSEFNEFKQVLDKLRTKGSDLIKHTPDSIEKQIVQKALADTNRQWLALQAKSAERSRKLIEAEHLTKDFDEVAGAVSEWLDGAKSVVKTPIQYGHFDKVREQLRQHRRVGRDIDYNLGRLAHLNSVTKQMALVCDASSAREQLAQLNQQVYNLQSETDTKLSSLEETNEEIEDFEGELAELRQWMDDTRAQLTMRDATLSLKEQLAGQEKLLEDIDSHKGKALLILQKQAELESLTSELALPPAEKLGSEITSLQQTARDQCATLRDAVNKQEEYDQDLEQLTSAINEAQEKLLASPVNPSDVKALKKQIAEHNLGAKEQELQQALHRQERYQQCVQEVTAKMDQAQHKLSRGFPTSLGDLDRQVNDYKAVLLDIEGIKEDLARVKERGRQVVEMSDPEGYKAMQATITMLSDRVQSLQSMADSKGRQLQSAMKDKEKHNISMSAYKMRVKELEDWLEEMKIRQSITPLPTDSVDSLRQNLNENQTLQNELNQKLQLISDLAVQCDNLCELETPANAEKLKSQLTNLQTQLGNLKLASIEKQGPLRSAIKESERRKKEMDEYESNVKKLQQWVTDTKQLTMVPSFVEPLLMPEDQQDLQQKLRSDLSQHRQLVRQLSSDATSREPRRDVTKQLPTISEEDLKRKWEEISAEMADRKQSLKNLLQQKDSDGSQSSYPSRLSSAESWGQLKDVRQNLAELCNLWQQLTMQVQDKQVRLDKALDFQQKYQDALQGISSWLDLAEQKLFSPGSDMDAQQRVRENENLQREIKMLQNEIAAMGRSSQDLLASVNKESQTLVKDSLANLNDRVRLLEEQARDQGQQLQQVDRQWQQYQDDMRNLQRNLADVRASMADSSSSTPLDQLISNMQKIEAQLKKCEGQLEEVKRKGEELSALAPQMVSTTELNSLQSNYLDLQRKVMDKKADLLQTVSVQDQYEKMLMDYAEFLETAQDKLKPETISAKDLDHLKHQLTAHKDFFSDLEVHRAMLDSLAGQSDKATQNKHAPQHQKLTNLTYVIQDKASLLGQKLDRLVRQWTELSEKQAHLTRFLDQMEEEVPIPVSSTDSVMAIQDKLTAYQTVQSQMADEKPTLYQVMDKGKQLLHSITCPPLESSVAEVGDRWVTLNSNISHELKRTETLGDQLQAFEGESIVFSSWLTAAKQKLAEIKHLSDQDQQSIATIRNKVEKLLEFKKEVEVQEPLKNKITQVGGQLSQNRTYSQGDFEPRIALFEEQWATLNHDIGKAEEYLHQSQMDLMPSRQALHELGTWLTIMERAVNEEKNRPVKDKADIEILLKKFKDFKIDLQNKQLTIDFVNQSSLQSQDGEGDQPVSADKTEFAERLGGLNKRWEVLSQDVSERLKTMETLHTKWAEYDRLLTRIQEWLREQEDKIKKHRLIGHEVSIRQSMKDCKVLKQTLEGKAGEIKSVQGLGQKLVDLSEGSPGCQESIKSSLDHIDKQWRHLQLQTAELETVLQEFLRQWQAYHQELQNANQILSETDYCLSRYNLVGGDITTLKMQVDKLKSLIGEVERGTAGYDRLITLGNQLIQVCEVPVRQEIQKTLADVQGRWSRTSAELQDRSARFEECLQQWQQFEDEHIRARRWLDSKEKLCNELVAMKEDSTRRDECLQRSKGLQIDLDNFQTQLSSLYQLSDDITKNMDTSSIVGITSRQSALESRVMAMRQILAKQVQALQGDLSQRQRFSDLLQAITAFLEDAERILGDEEMNKSHDEQALRERYEELKHLMNQFNNNMTQLDALNDLGYRMALSEEKSLELRELNHKWQRLYSECKERNKTLQGIMLIQQDFSEKCDAWMTFLAQTEHDLSTEIASNLPDLVIQQRNCEKFESDMYSKQQILHAIISDGQKMMKEGEVEDKEEFQQKLHLLAEQWQSVVRRANQRKAIIDNTIKQWQAFNELTERLRDWLTEKEFGLKAFELDLVSLQKIKNLLDKARHIQTEFKLEEDTLHKMQEQSKQLIARADTAASDEIKVCTAQVTQYWYQIYGKLEDHCNTLEEVLKQWQECEEDIEDILLWLKDTRKALSAELPTSYDQLQAELHRCKDIESAFDNSEDKRQMLLAKEKKLAEVIQPDDLNVLHQRVRLLNKQWFELQNQAALRCQRINDNCLRWSSFNDRVKDLHDWIDQMEVKVISTKEHHIEDLLTRMQKDFREEMAEKEREKNRLDRQGHDLMKVSSEVRSADIENRLQRLDEKWQHLVSVLGFRQRKLQETLLAVQQLDVSMANLRKWLSNMEHDLSEPVIYQESDRAEIQLKLRRQQELQSDIEHHSAGVGSVLNLCEVLLHDNDACPTEVEFNALQTAMKTLDRRWRHICQLSPDRRKRIEETWDLWQNLMDDCKSFDDWLRDAELEVRESAIDQMDATMTKDEIRRFEDLQRKVHENLSNLESINKQYRRLAREGRTDHSRVLKQLVEDANSRWDKLQQHVSAIMRRLKHSASLREDFTNTTDSLHTWLTEVDMQLTNVEHLSTLDIPTKLEEVKGIQDDISDKQKKIAYLDQSALYLIQKGDSMDAIRVQKELEDFKQYARSVFGRVDKYEAKLKRLSDVQADEIPKIPHMPDELDELERQLKADHPPGLDWQLEELEAYLESSPPESPPEKRRTTGRGILQDRPLSPVRGVGVSHSPRRSTSPIREKSISPLRTSSPASRSRSRTKSRSPSRYAQRSPIRSPRMSPSRSMTSLDSVDAGISREERRRRIREDIANRTQAAKVEDLLVNLVDALEEAKAKLRVAEREVKFAAPKGLGVDSGSEYTKMMLDCERAVEKVRRLDRLAKSETGLSTIPSADEEVMNVLHRWEQLQAQNIEKDYRISQHRQEWHQFRADLDNMLDWLDTAEAMQARRAELPDDIVHLDSIIRQHKMGIPKDFLLQLESKKARVLSINLLSKNFIDIRTDEGRLLKEKVRQMNRRWDSICAQATHLQKDLQLALMQCQEFHHTIHDLLLWLENIETKLQQNEPINLGVDESALWSRLKKLKELKSDLENNQPRVISLKETADQLLMNTDSTEMVNAKDKMHIIANRLRALLRLCSSYITSLESRLEDVSKKSHVSPLSSLERSLDSHGDDLSFGSQSPRNTSSPRYSSFRPTSLLRNRTRSPIALSRQLYERITGSSAAATSAAAPGDNLTGQPDELSGHPGLFRRVLRTALPLQVLLLLLLGLASLVPMCEDDYSCVLMNNFRRSLDPMLRYMDGPPPT